MWTYYYRMMVGSCLIFYLQPVGLSTADLYIIYPAAKLLAIAADKNISLEEAALYEKVTNAIPKEIALDIHREALVQE